MNLHTANNKFWETNNTFVGSEGGGVKSVNGKTGVVTLDPSDIGAEPSVNDVTVTSTGSVTQALTENTFYHFTGELTSLTVTAEEPTSGLYQFEFISGNTAPTLTFPETWIIPDQFIIEPKAKYKIVVEDGFMYLNKWADDHSPFIYLDVTAGDFVVDSNNVTASAIYSNVGTEIVTINFSDVKPKNQISNNGRLTVCSVSAKAKSLIGSTYVSGVMCVGTTGKMTEVIFNTWQDSAIIEIHNNTGGAISANTPIYGTLYLLRTL